MHSFGSDTVLPKPSLSTQMLHADRPPLSNSSIPLAPAISVSTTFRNPLTRYRKSSGDQDESSDDEESDDSDESTFRDPNKHIYSRCSNDTGVRAQKVLDKLLNGRTLLYPSGLAAAYAALLHFAPTVVAVRGGYHGVHESLRVYGRQRGLRLIDLDDHYPCFDDVEVAYDDNDHVIPAQGGERLLVWLETPLNPTGEARDIQKYADRAHAAGAKLMVDATFAPPPLMDPFKHGADYVMHSATKYLGGHSDLLCGVLAVRTQEEWTQLHYDRTFVGTVPGNLEMSLLLRSLRTLHMRVMQQARTATALAYWLRSLASTEPLSCPREEDVRQSGIVAWVYHAAFQSYGAQDKGLRGALAKARELEDPNFDPIAAGQLLMGAPTFSMRLSKTFYASHLPHRLDYFTPATSLGGVESLIEQRCLSSPSDDSRLLRLSVGLEDLEDLKADLLRGFSDLVAEKALQVSGVKQTVYVPSPKTITPTKIVDQVPAAPVVYENTTRKAQQQLIKTPVKTLSSQFPFVAPKGAIHVNSLVIWKLCIPQLFSTALNRLAGNGLSSPLPKLLVSFD